MSANWIFKGRKKVAFARILSIFEDSYLYQNNNREASFVTVDTNDWATILPITDDGKFIMVEQYRFGSKSVSLEFPGGAIDSNEDPAQAAARELEEETGYTTNHVQTISVQNPNPAFMTNTFNIVLATGCTPAGQTKFDEFEDISAIKLLTYDEVVNYFTTNKITHSLMYAVFLAYLLHTKQT